MTTRDFIYKKFYGYTNATSCSSVFGDSDGTIYSYGYHYPLLFTVKGKTVRNVTGYSNTTARHIHWSRDVDAIDIVAGGGFRLSSDDETNYNKLVESQRKYVQRLADKLASKKRKDTQVYKWLEHDYLQAANNLKELLA